MIGGQATAGGSATRPELAARVARAGPAAPASFSRLSRLTTRRLLLRAATPADLGMLAVAFAAERPCGGGTPGSAQRWRIDAAAVHRCASDPTNGHRHVLAIEERATGAPVGLAEVLVPAADGVPWIGLLAIVPARRNHGLGGEAADGIARDLAGRGWGAVRLSVDIANVDALRFWKRRGYHEIRDAWRRHDGLVPESRILSMTLPRPDRTGRADPPARPPVPEDHGGMSVPRVPSSLPSGEVVPMDASHLEAAAALVVAGYRGLLRRRPAMPERWGRPESIRTLLGSLLECGSALALVHDGRLTAFLGAVDVDDARGAWTYTPEWAHGSGEAGRIGAYHALYAAHAERSIGRGRRTHGISVFDGDAGATEALARLGFGLVVVDAIRDLSPVRPAPAARRIRVRRGVPADIDAVVELDDALWRYLAGPPIFAAVQGGDDRAELLARLEDVATATLLAEESGRVVAYLRIGPSRDNACTVVRDPATACIDAAFTLDEWRRHDVATLLLDAALRWARDAGYARCSVDFETANASGRGFWLGRGFRPVVVSSMRTVLAPPA